MSRKVFSRIDNPTETVCAAGLLLWKRIESGVYYLVVEEQDKDQKCNYYSDPGGKVDDADETPLATAYREFREETKEDVPELLNCVELYNPCCKYLLHVCEISPSVLIVPVCGRWVKLVSLLGNGSHPRIRSLTAEIGKAVRQPPTQK